MWETQGPSLGWEDPVEEKMATHSSILVWKIPWIAVCQASLSFTISKNLLKLMSIELVMPSNHIILCCPLLLLLSLFLSIRVFSSESTLLFKWKKHCRFRFSISPSNEYSGPIFLRLTGFSSLQSKGLSRLFSKITVQNHQFFSTQLSL